MVDMTKVTIMEELTALTVDVTKVRCKCHCYALVTPLLAEAIQTTDMKINSIFTKFVKTIKDLTTPPAEGSVAEDEDAILTRLSDPYDSLLYFMWACHKLPAEVASLPMQEIEDEPLLAWEMESRVNALGVASQSHIDLPGTNQDTGMADGIITAMTKLSVSTISHQAATLKKQEEKDDSTLKAWRWLLKL